MAAHDNLYGGNAEGNEADICMVGDNSVEGLMRRINSLQGKLLSVSNELVQLNSHSGMMCLSVDDDYIIALYSYNYEVGVYDHDGTMVNTAFSGINGTRTSCFAYGGEYFVTRNYDATDTHWHRIEVTDPAHWGTITRTIGSYGSGDGEFQNITGMFIYANEIYALDSALNRVQVFTLDGTYDRQWGSSGDGEGEFDAPCSILVYDDEVYIGDSGNERIQVFDLDGNFRREWPCPGFADDLSECVGMILARRYITHIGARYIFMWVLYDTYGTVVAAFRLDNTHCIRTHGSQLFSGRDQDEHGLWSVLDVGTVVSLEQTEFFAYTDTGPVSLGAPDGGVSIPEDDAIMEANGNVDCNMILDMRTAIETIIAAGQTPYNWTPSDQYNLYRVAMGNRSKYGGTSEAYDWTRTGEQMASAFSLADIDIGEIYECVITLEALMV